LSATQKDAASSGVGQLHVRTAGPERGVGSTGVGREAVLDQELSRQTAAQIFIAAEAEARAARLLHLPSLRGAVGALVDGGAAIALRDALVNATIDGDRRLCRRNTGKCAQHCESEQRFFHCDYLLS
jgi:hypothetical protein